MGDSSGQPQYLTPDELAARFAVSAHTIRRLLYVRTSPVDPVPPGRIAAIKLGTAYRIHVDDAAAFEMRPSDRCTAPAARVKATKRRRACREAAGQIPDYFGDDDEQ